MVDPFVYAKGVDGGASEVVHEKDSRDGAVVVDGVEPPENRRECRLRVIDRAGSAIWTLIKSSPISE
jgi:hypothetical protein